MSRKKPTKTQLWSSHCFDALQFTAFGPCGSGRLAKWCAWQSMSICLYVSSVVGHLLQCYISGIRSALQRTRLNGCDWTFCGQQVRFSAWTDRRFSEKFSRALIGNLGMWSYRFWARRFQVHGQRPHRASINEQQSERDAFPAKSQEVGDAQHEQELGLFSNLIIDFNPSRFSWTPFRRAVSMVWSILCSCAWRIIRFANFHRKFLNYFRVMHPHSQEVAQRGQRFAGIARLESQLSSIRAGAQLA